MNYFVNSTWSYLKKKLDRMLRDPAGGHRLLVTLPTLPEQTMLLLAETLSERCLEITGLDLTLKVAEVGTSGWTATGLGRARSKGWLDDRGNLTYYRNLAGTPGKTSLFVLCGTDRVTDSASLADFHRCDSEVIWKQELNSSFQDWVGQKLRSSGMGAVEALQLKEFDLLLKPLCQKGKADLQSISDWLEDLDFANANTPADAFKVMLGHLGAFQLPKLTGFDPGKKRLTLARHIDTATDFFNYTMFLDEKARKKTLGSIEQYREALGEQEGLTHATCEDVKGPYPDMESLLDGLTRFVATESATDKARLLECDFATISEKILKFRAPSEKAEKSKTAHKLAGGPIEMALHAVWRTLRTFAIENTGAELVKIEISADRFKHDYEGADGNDDIDATLDRSESARRYLQRLLGGVDQQLNTQIQLPGAEGQDVAICSRLAHDDVDCVFAKTAEPLLEFSVRIWHRKDPEPIHEKFAWRLPEIHTYRLAESLLQWAKSLIETHPDTWILPAFHLPYYEELLRASDEEETRRVMVHCVRDARPETTKVANLLAEDWMETSDVLLEPLKALAERYVAFIKAAFARGLHASLFAEEGENLHKAYRKACETFVEIAGGAESQMAGMLLRAFLVVQERIGQSEKVWGAERYEQSGIVTVLHPALLEMLKGHVLFLFSCFNSSTAMELKLGQRRKAFAESVWCGFVDLGSIQSPLMGLLYNEDQNLDTNVRGSGLIHRIGSPMDREASLSTRLLVRYDNGSDEDPLADTEMFRESRESKLVYRLLTDYFRLHPHARDGLSIAVFRNQDIQPIIAAVHQYLTKLADPKDRRYYVLTPERKRPYAIGITLFSQSGDDVGVSRWLEQWQERWEAAETDEKLQVYRRCRFSLAHRVVEGREFGSFQKLINDTFEADIAIIYNFIGAGQSGNKFAQVAKFDVTQQTLKFPILEKSCCTVRHPTDQFKRSRVISNRQFVLCSLHAEVMHRLKNQGVQPETQFVILGTGDFGPWRGVVDAFHRKAEWVVCIDPNMDERLVQDPLDKANRKREIIGFGSGVGAHGEANYTISTEQFSLQDIQERLGASLQEVYSGQGWTMEDYRASARMLLPVTKDLSGLSIVRATGVGHYIRDFLAYSITRKMLRETSRLLCDHMVSLDAYRHWFDLAEDEQRPDLMWLTASIDAGNRVCLRVHLIECKVSDESEQPLAKARAQINNGLKVLTRAFASKAELANDHVGEDNRPDQRYWWLQLHRLITSKSEIEAKQDADVLSAMERLAEGDYTIEWGASVFAFWRDNNAADVKCIGHWNPLEGSDLRGEIYAIGSEYVRKQTGSADATAMNWSEWRNAVQTSESNICRVLDSVEVAQGGDDDDDLPPWNDTTEPADEPAQEVEAQPLDRPELEDQPILNDPVAEEPIPEQPAQEAPAPPPAVADIPQQVEAIAPRLPQRILLGEAVNGGRPVHWEFGHPGLANRHMLVFGTSGMGKTYFIQCLLTELARAGQNSLIIDYTDGFINSKIEPATKEFLKPVQHFIQQEPLPINPFKAQVSHEDGMVFKDSPMAIAKRIAAIFKSVYSMGDQQFAVLIDAISEGLEKDGDNFDLLKLLDMLTGFLDDEVHSGATVRTTISKLKSFMKCNPFSKDEKGIGWAEVFGDQTSRCHVFQFFKVDRHSACALIEFVLWDLYAFVSTYGNKNQPRVVVLDEVQNMDLGPEGPVAKYLTEGRKHGLALVTATQTVKGVGGVNDARVSRLFQAEHKVFFKPTENEMKDHAVLLHNAISKVSVQEWASRLATLQVGECWSLGRCSRGGTNELDFQAQRIKITGLAKRGFNG